jgi:hypothetical protein
LHREGKTDIIYCINFLRKSTAFSLEDFMTLSLSSARDVQEFVSLAASLPYTVLVEDGERCVDTKSVLQMFALNFSAPLRLRIDEEHRENFRALAQKFLTA